MIETDPDLRVVLDLPDHLDLHIWILTHPDLRQVARVKAFMRFIAEAVKESE